MTKSTRKARLEGAAAACRPAVAEGKALQTDRLDDMVRWSQLSLRHRNPERSRYAAAVLLALLYQKLNAEAAETCLRCRAHHNYFGFDGGIYHLYAHVGPQTWQLFQYNAQHCVYTDPFCSTEDAMERRCRERFALNGFALEAEAVLEAARAFSCH